MRLQSLGARPLRRAMQHEVEDRLSEKILHGELNSGDHVKVGAENGEFTFTGLFPGTRHYVAGASGSLGLHHVELGETKNLGEVKLK